MHLNRSSATNCAQLYNMSIENEFEPAPEGWATFSTLTSDHVWDSFLLLTLLEDHRTQCTTLQIPHRKDAETDSPKQFMHETYASHYSARKSFVTTVISVCGSIRMQMGVVSPIVTIYLPHQADYYRAHHICSSD